MRKPSLHEPVVVVGPLCNLPTELLVGCRTMFAAEQPGWLYSIQYTMMSPHRAQWLAACVRACVRAYVRKYVTSFIGSSILWRPHPLATTNTYLVHIDGINVYTIRSWCTCSGECEQASVFHQPTTSSKPRRVRAADTASATFLPWGVVKSAADVPVARMSDALSASINV